MDAILIGGKTLSKLKLPSKIEGSFFLEDPTINKDIINIEAENSKWILKKGNEEAKILDKDNQVIEKRDVIENEGCIVSYQNINKIVWFSNSYDETFNMFKVNSNTNLTIGKDNNNLIIYNNLYIQQNHMVLTLENGKWFLQVGNNSLVYLNEGLVQKNIEPLANGDRIFCFGLKIIIFNNYIIINNPTKNLTINTDILTLVEYQSNDYEYEEVNEEELYKDNDYFFNTPRLRRFIDTYELNIANPPQKAENQEMPLLLTVGPMLTMALISLTTALTAANKIFTGQTTLKESWMSLLTPLIMITTSLLWPNLTKSWQKKQKKKKEKIRVEKYSEYLETKSKEIKKETNYQMTVLKENLLDLKECYNIIVNKKRTLWERKISQRDFLTVRLGKGNIPIDMDIKFSNEEFVIENDPLKDKAIKMVEEAKMLHDVPISYSFFKKKATAIMGKNNLVTPFVDNLILQLITYHSFDELKIVIFTDGDNKSRWDKYKNLPHLFSDDKSIRFFSTNTEESKNLSIYLEQEFIKRISLGEDAIENENDKITFTPYYLILTDNYIKIRKLGICDKILEFKEDVGFGYVILEDRLSRLPSKCINFINVDTNFCGILRNGVDDYYQQAFNHEIDESIDMKKCVESLANIPIEFVQDLRYLPTSLSFLEMYKVGKVEQLNTLNRWRLNDPINSLRAQIGINDEGNLIYLDLHEKYHGPHGLIAGTTGSGKSEFIITYILSLAVNYSPEEVAFILIDYKGGGLAGAFENKTKGLRLPHLAGTITNLDKSELNRTLISIDSELKRRQTKFNEVRDKLGESTIDIYKYQKFYREKKIDEPMPHLFIISDEFAELKAQQPEFMNDLISAARIGRSLGIHLILATQKPSGVVNDQIWSNTKFRVCLKVQDKNDSNEMLKLPDAATITNAGRFYLQVGNNEIFVLGQSGWAGAQYIASDTAKKKYDRSISFIDNLGNIVKSLEETEQVVKKNDQGDELSNVLKYVCELAGKENIKANNLWLDSIPENIFVDNLVKKYNYTKKDIVTAILGEYDAPSKQHQGLLTLKFDDESNTLIYGVSGANREMLLSSIIYSLCTQYQSEDINLYLIDYGSESLRMYNKFPQVGDAVYANEDDKLNKLLALINEEILHRKKIFADYNGEYKTYKKLSGKQIPLKIIMINNYDSFKENNSNLEETLIKLTREGERYGIIFVISANSSRSIYSKLERNFHNKFMLDMTDRNDYIDVLGRIGNIYPAEYEGRGLYKADEVYEFQTAQVCNIDDLVEFINKRVEQVKQVCKTKAPIIPSLPEEVTAEQHLLPSLNNINSLPIGIIRRNLKIFGYNFFNDKANIISAKDIKSCIKLLETIIYEVRTLNHMTVLIDTEQELSSIGGTVNTYVDKNFEEFILRFEDFLDKEIDGKQVKVLCIISGLEKFQSSLYEKKAKGFFNGVKTLENINLIFVDSSFKLKKIGYEQWYTGLVNNINGIWVGPGFMEQTVINCNDYSNKFKEKINNQFAWIAKNGEAELVKIVGSKENENDE